MTTKATQAKKKVAPPHLHSNREADHDVDPPESLESRMDALEEMIGNLREEFETHKTKLHDAGIRLAD